MPFQPTKPLAGDRLNISQGDLAGNFTTVGYMVDPNNQYIKFPRTMGVPVTAATTAGLYGADSVTSPGTTALWFLPQNAGAPIDFTSASLISDGWCRLPNGLIMKFGNFNLAINTTITHNFNVLPVAFTTLISFNATYVKAANYNSIAWVRATSTTGFTVENESAVNAMRIHYFALGV